MPGWPVLNIEEYAIAAALHVRTGFGVPLKRELKTLLDTE